MTIEAWLEAALADAERRGLDGLKPLLQTLAESTRQLRAADWNDDATGGRQNGGAAEKWRRTGGPVA
jgi:hypothetical protein